MDFHHIGQKYISLCSRFHIDLKILCTNSSKEPKFRVSDESSQVLLTMNTARISSEQYEGCLAYAVAGVLLPRLVLQTERLILRRFRSEDAKDCLDFLSDQEGAYMDCSQAFSSMDGKFQELMDLFVEQESRYAVVLRETERVIGTVHIFPEDTKAVWAMEIGYSISPAHRRKGYATEALSALLDLVQGDLMVDMVLAGILPENHISKGLLKKLGFAEEGLRHKAAWHEGLNCPVDLVYYYRDRE